MTLNLISFHKQLIVDTAWIVSLSQPPSFILLSRSFSRQTKQHWLFPLQSNDLKTCRHTPGREDKSGFIIFYGRNSPRWHHHVTVKGDECHHRWRRRRVSARLTPPLLGELIKSELNHPKARMARSPHLKIILSFGLNLLWIRLIKLDCS